MGNSKAVFMSVTRCQAIEDDLTQEILTWKASLFLLHPYLNQDLLRIPFSPHPLM